MVSSIAVLPASENNSERKIHESFLSNPSSIEESNEDQQNIQARKIIRYWRNALVDMEKIKKNPKDMQEGLEFSLADFKLGQLSKSKILPLFEKLEKAQQAYNARNAKKYKGKKSLEQSVFIQKIKVIIVPYILSSNYENQKKIGQNKNHSICFPLWMVATLTREGKLIPGEEITLPWIERTCLTPNEINFNRFANPILGDMAQVDAFYVRHENSLQGNRTGWQDLFTFAQKLLFSLFDEAKAQSPLSYTLLEQGFLLNANDNFGFSQNIIKIYDQYSFSSKKIPQLLKKFCQFDEVALHSPLATKALFDASRHHLGQMQKAYPLSASQRLSLSHMVDLPSPDIFTIHGPPGTGKTDFLLSVVATQWVKAAFLQQPPPIIVVASSNNLAVTNILDRFEQVARGELVNKRWLPRLNSYGLYLVSSNDKFVDKADQLQYLYRKKEKNSGSIETFFSFDYQVSAKTYFLTQFNEYANLQITDLEKIKEWLHQRLAEKQDLLNQTIDFAVKTYPALLEVIKTYGDLATVVATIDTSQNEKQQHIERLEKTKLIYDEWLNFKLVDLKWLRCLIWIPIVKSIIKDKIAVFTSKHEALFTQNFFQFSTIEEVDQLIAHQLAKLGQQIVEIDQKLCQLHDLLNHHKKFDDEKIYLEMQLNFSLNLTAEWDFSNPSSLLNQLDQTLRFDMFWLATHYWEAKWLLENSMLSKLTFNSEGRQKYWQLHAMLTPCLITTLQTGPGFFQYRTQAETFENLTDFIDLLIIEEAGQALPAIAGGMIAIAKNLLLVGDPKQIQPIFSLTRAIDCANAKKAGLINDKIEYEKLKNQGIWCSGDPNSQQAYGNMITIGQRKSPFHLKSFADRGMMLVEHRRCAKEIISYCNELCYDNRLIPMTIERDFDFPRMGYAHIKGRVEKVGSSRFNLIEAQTIVSWIKKNHHKILTSCQATNLSDCLAIVTPFAAQQKVIAQALAKQELEPNIVGTIHTLQGAEKSLIIFSSVYSAEEEVDTLFFDRSPNMLNVAVSRAQQSFLVFGDMDIFDVKNPYLPSGLLAKYLFAREENEIVDITQSPYYSIDAEDIEQINTLADHRQILGDAFRQTQYELNIVSPFLATRAIREDDILSLITQHTPRIQINIYADPNLNSRREVDFRQAKTLLVQAGAKVFLVNNVHSKIIAIDEEVIIVGSFNWLSAVRTIEEFKREEISMIYKGRRVAEFIEKAMRPIRAKANL